MYAVRHAAIVLLASGMVFVTASGRTARAGPPTDGPQQGLRKLRTLGGADGTLYRVRGAAFRDTDLVVISGGEPAVHLFSGTGQRSWGRKGGGPAEVGYPADVVWLGQRILVRDSDQERVITYDPSGRFLASRPLAPYTTDRLALTGSDTLVGALTLGQRHRAVLRLRAARADTVLRYLLPEQIRLRAEGSPPLTLTPPYSAVPGWAAMIDGRIAFWDGQSAQIQMLDRTGRGAGALPLPGGQQRVSRADRELWLNNSIPQSFRGQRVFEPLRQEARRSVAFPTYLPPVLEMLADPSGGVWVRRTTAAQGELWTWLRPGRPASTVRMPPNQQLIAVGTGQLAVLARDELDVERIDVYANPFQPQERAAARR